MMVLILASYGPSGGCVEAVEVGFRLLAEEDWACCGGGGWQKHEQIPVPAPLTDNLRITLVQYTPRSTLWNPIAFF